MSSLDEVVFVVALAPLVGADLASGRVSKCTEACEQPAPLHPAATGPVNQLEP